MQKRFNKNIISIKKLTGKGRLSAVLMAGLCALTACGGQDASQMEEGRTDVEQTVGRTDGGQEEPVTLVYGSGDYTRINPALDEHGEINLLLFDGLTSHNGKNEVAPGLAKSWEFDETACTYTFHLEEGVVWHDGEPFTAEDVKFTIEAVMDPENASENAPNFEDVEEITVTDEHTVSFRLSAPNVAFLDYMTMAVLPEHLLAGEDMQTSDFFRAPVGTGPYKLESWDVGQAIVLTKNEDYFKGTPHIDQVIFKIVSDDNAKTLQMAAGELDLALLPPKAARSFADREGYVCYDMKTADYRGILFNFNNPFWQENRDIIPAERYEYSPEKAAEILEAAGCVRGEDGIYRRGGEPLSFVISVGAGDQVRVDMAQAAAQQIRAVGIDCAVEIPTKVDWNSQMSYLIGWGSPFDADDHTYKVFGTGKGANYSGYSNAAVDRYLTQARSSDDPEARAESYARFQEELAKDPAYAFICYIDANYVADASIRGITADTVMGHHGVGIFWNIAEWTK